MSILAQCGYGRANKIDQGLDDGVIQGVIMSPRDEGKDRLETTIRQWGNNYPDAFVLFDPQFYATTLNAPRDGHLSEYDYYGNNNGLGRTHFSGSLIRGYVKECLDYQSETFGNDVAYIVSPSILFDDFRDNWSQVALNMAVESVDYHANLEDPKPLLVSIVVSETAFRSLDAVEEFLDTLTEMEVDGFYVIIRCNATSLQNAIEAASFSKLMYFLYVLADVNEYTVIVGYSNWYSFLLESVGVDYTACGWYQNLRQFSLARFLPSTGGSRPRKRYSSSPLFSSLLITPELQDAYLANLLSDVLSGVQYDHVLTSNPTAGEPSWSDEISCLAHWASLHSLSNQIALQASTHDRVQEALQLINMARTLYSRLESNGISYNLLTGHNHLNEWRDSIQEFKSIAGI